MSLSALNVELVSTIMIRIMSSVCPFIHFSMYNRHIWFSHSIKEFTFLFHWGILLCPELHLFTQPAKPWPIFSAFSGDFIYKVSSTSPTRHFIIHSRKALLNGISPAENRTIPPLKYVLQHCLMAYYTCIRNICVLWACVHVAI